MSIFKKKEKEISILKKYQPTFKTIDGKEHVGKEYNWANSSNLSCSVGEYLMIDINNSGYIKDCNSVMYPLSNVLSIEWKLLERKIAYGDVSKYSLHTFFDDNEVSKMDVIG